MVYCGFGKGTKNTLLLPWNNNEIMNETKDGIIHNPDELYRSSMIDR